MYLPGTMLIWAAFLLGVGSTIAFGLSTRGNGSMHRIARQTYGLMTTAIVLASILLMYLLLTHDYRLSYVWAYSDNALPLHYLISTFWAGQEGSFLLWVFCGVLLGVPLMFIARHYERRVMLFYNLTLLSLILLLLKQDPFRFHQGMTAGQVPLDGQGLNPLLQNPWMVIHPPIMFIGYASLAIPFCFALAALWMRRYDEWTRATLPWVLLSVVTLGTAIMMGGYWAYETLGWGGYWGWDPVENASLVPWLLTVALAHGMLLQRSRKRFRRTNLVLAVAAHLMVIYATFLTRSGVLADFSVHSFVDLGMTGWLVLIMLFFLVLSVVLLALRWRDVPRDPGDEPFLSRTIFLVLGILLLVGTALMVSVGTSSPLITRLWTDPATVGPDFYNRVGFPLAIAFGLVLGFIPFLGWRKPVAGAGRRLVVVAAITAALAVVAFVLGIRSPAPMLYAATAMFAVVGNGWLVVDRARGGGWGTAGGALSHVGMALMLLAFLTTGLYDSDQKARLTLDEPVEVLGYSMTFRGVEKRTPQARDAMVIEVERPGGGSFVLKPRMWVNKKSNQLVANPDVKSFATRDLYVAPVQYDPGEKAAPSGRLTLEHDVPAVFRDWRLIFRGFDMSGQDAVPGALSVGVVIDIERPDADPVTVRPSIVSTGEETRAEPVAIPGTETGQISATGLSVESGMVRVELHGLGGGVGRTALLEKGETLAYEGLRITFSDFDMSDFEPEEGRINIGVPLTVEREGRTEELEITVRQMPQGGMLTTPVTVPDAGGISLDIGAIDAEGGTVQLQILDPSLPAAQPELESFVVDVSVKPLISLVWIGTLLVIAGVIMALGMRRRDLASIPGAEAAGA